MNRERPRTQLVGTPQRGAEGVVGDQSAGGARVALVGSHQERSVLAGAEGEPLLGVGLDHPDDVVRGDPGEQETAIQLQKVTHPHKAMLRDLEPPANSLMAEDPSKGP